MDPVFKLYNRKNEYSPVDLSFNQSHQVYIESGFNPKLETKILVHGFMDGPNLGAWMRKVREAFLFEKDYNVIILDWSKTNFLPYVQVEFDQLINYFIINSI